MGSTPGDLERRSVDILLSNGKTYTVMPLVFADYGEVANFIRTKYVRMYRESTAGLVEPDEIHKRVMEILKMSISPEDLQSHMDVVDVMILTAYFAIKNNPGVTLEFCKRTLASEDITIISNASNSLEPAGDDAVNPPEPIPEKELAGEP